LESSKRVRPFGIGVSRPDLTGETTALNASSDLKPIRRSTRLALEIPVLITSLDLRSGFCEECKTVAVNAHGCGVVTSEALKVGSQVTVDLLDVERSIRGNVVVGVPLDDAGSSGWLTGIEFVTPSNFWGLEDPPADWVVEGPAPV
jgi:hypothetical protein